MPRRQFPLAQVRAVDAIPRRPRILTVNRATLTLSGFAASNKTYDGTARVDSGNTNADTLKVMFTKAGKYNYYCDIHGGYDPTTGQVFGMSGTITVAAG